MSAIDQPDPVEPFDSALRFHVQSSREPHIKHLVDLDSFDCNGECSCEDFIFPRKKGGLSKLACLERRLTPEEAIAAGWVKVPDSGVIEDALRCKHLVQGIREIGIACVRVLAKAEKAKR